MVTLEDLLAEEEARKREEEERKNTINESFKLFLGGNDEEKYRYDVYVKGVPSGYGSAYLSHFIYFMEGKIIEYISSIRKSVYSQTITDEYGRKSSYCVSVVYKEDYYNEEEIDKYVEQQINYYEGVEWGEYVSNYRFKYKTPLFTGKAPVGERKQECVEKLKEIIRQIGKQMILLYPERYPEYFKMKSKKEELEKWVGLIQAYNNMSWIEKKIFNFKYRKTAPTLSAGWFTYIILMVFGIILNGKIAWWLFVTGMFIVWRKREIDKYN